MAVSPDRSQVWPTLYTADTLKYHVFPTRLGPAGSKSPQRWEAESHTSQRGIGAHAATNQGGTCVSDWTVPSWSLNRDWRHLSLFPDPAPVCTSSSQNTPAEPTPSQRYTHRCNSSKEGSSLDTWEQPRCWAHTETAAPPCSDGSL